MRVTDNNKSGLFRVEADTAGTTWAFDMNYGWYILGVLAIGLFCLILIRRATGSEHGPSRSRLASKRGVRGHATETELNTRQILQRELRHTPTPWGWVDRQRTNDPNRRRPGFFTALIAFKDRLVRKKELAGSRSSNDRINASFRALLEDRYAPASRQSMKSMQYRKVKPPLLRDPSAPHDQMDNLGTSKAEHIGTKLPRPARVNVGPRGKTRKAENPETDLTNIKQPWGW